MGEELDSNHPAYGWLILHAGELHNRFQKGEDGKTPNERWKGKNGEKKAAAVICVPIDGDLWAK